jgi:broad specificity phosphatase PhoE
VLGQSQAEAIGKELAQQARISKSHVYTSPLGRALSTAEIICRASGISLDRRVQFDELAEMNFGEWEGLTDEEIEERFPREQDRRNRNKWNYVFPGGESYASLHVRLSSWFARFRNVDPLIVVTHDMVSRTLRGIYLNHDSEHVLQLIHPQNRIYKLVGNVESQLDVNLNG